MRNLFLSAALVCAAAIPAAAQIGAPSDGFSYTGPFGPSPDATPTYAQTFMRPAAGLNYLQSFTFNLGDYNSDASGSGLLFRGAVYALNGTHLGMRLWQSTDLRTGSTNYFGFDAYTFTTTNLFLDPSTSAFAFVLQSESTDPASVNAIATGTLDYDGGAFYTVSEDGTFTAVDGTSDAAFDAEFTDSPVPEPATLVLFGSGLLAIGGVARRRVRQS